MKKLPPISNKILLGLLLLSTILLAAQQFNPVQLALNSPIYAKALALVTKTVIVEVEPTLPPIDPRVMTAARYMKARNSKLSVEITELIAYELVKASKAHGLAVPLLIGVMEHESLFNPSTTTSIPGTGGVDFARGLMQVYQGEGIEIDQNQIYDLGYNLDIGCQILNKKIELNNGDLENALANYSGNANGYTDNVLANVGRFTLFQIKQGISEREVALR